MYCLFIRGRATNRRPPLNDIHVSTIPYPAGPGASPSVENFLLVGSAIHDTEEYVFSVTVEVLTRTLDDAPTDPEVAPGQVLRYAYAPTGNPDEIAVSLWWAEQDYDPDSQAYVDRETSEDRPIYADGRYRLRLKPVSR